MENTIAIRLPLISKILLSRQYLQTKVIFIALASLVFLLLAVYIFQLGQWISAEYSTNRLESQIQKVQEENLGISSLTASSLLVNGIESKLAELGYIKTEKISYISISSGHLAQSQNILVEKSSN